MSTSPNWETVVSSSGPSYGSMHYDLRPVMVDASSDKTETYSWTLFHGFSAAV